MNRLKTILKLFILIFLCSCVGTRTYINQIKIDEGYYHLGKIIILHLGGIYNNRKVIEDELTYWLNHEGYNAFPSYRYLQNHNLPDRLELSGIIKENNFDGILITQLKDINTRERFENTQERYSTSPTDPVFYNYLDTYKNQFSAGYSFLERTYVVDIELHAIEEEKLIFKSTIETRETTSQDFAVEDFSKTIAKALRKSKLLKKKD